MATPIFRKTGVSDLAFSRGLLFPVEKPQEVIQVVDRTAGGSLQVENLGVTVHTRRLTMRGLGDADISSLRTWHETVAQGAYETFTYVDEDGASNTVRWLDDTLNAPEYYNGRYSVEIMLEVVS